jgi:branched-chain amino acid transport system permease protein
VNTRALLRSVAPVLTTALLLIAVPAILGGSPYGLRIASLTVIVAIYAVAFNLLFGHTRQLFLCVGALAGLGAYAFVLLSRDARLASAPALVIVTGVVAAFGAFLSYVSVRRGFGVLFVGVVTLAVSLMFHNVLLGLRQYTNGETGLVTRGVAFGLGEHPKEAYFVLIGVLVVALTGYQALLHSRHGLAFHALGDDEVSAELSGIDVTKYKVGTAAIASGLIGLVGALYADVNGFISPAVFVLGHVDIPVFVALLLGGMRTLLGPVVGAVLFSAVDEVVRPFGQLTVLTYGTLLVVLVLLFREGVVPAAHRVFIRLSRPASAPRRNAQG